MPLAAQFVAAKLSPWDNRWSEVYDFTPNANGTKNFSLLDIAQEDAFPVKALSAVGEWAWCVGIVCVSYLLAGLTRHTRHTSQEHCSC